MYADFKTNQLHRLLRKKTNYTRRLCFIASSAAGRTCNKLSAKICEDLRYILIYHISLYKIFTIIPPNYINPLHPLSILTSKPRSKEFEHRGPALISSQRSGFCLNLRIEYWNVGIVEYWESKADDGLTL